MKHVTPMHGEDSFHCPKCGVYAKQEWYEKVSATDFNGEFGINLGFATVCICSYCKTRSIWINSKLVYPDAAAGPMPSVDMPDDVKADYEEARAVFNASPRSSAALLRLALQKLCVHLGETGKNINEDIASLVKKGLPPGIQKGLDVLRVVGNNAVHPGEIDINDKPAVASSLFGVINAIVDRMITHPKELDDLYSQLPQGALDSIEKRDKPKT